MTPRPAQQGVLCSPIAKPAGAQSGSQKSGEEGIPDIVVTATRQATNLQDTPIAITAVTAEALGERGITNAALMVSGLSKQREGYQKRLDFTCGMIRRGTPQLAGSYPSSNVPVTHSPNFTPSDCTIGRLGGEDVHAGRASVLWEPTPSVRLTLNGDHIRDLSENAADTGRL